MTSEHIRDISILLERSKEVLANLKLLVKHTGWERAEIDRFVALIEDTEKEIKSLIDQVTSEIFIKGIERRRDVDRRQGSTDETK